MSAVEKAMQLIAQAYGTGPLSATRMVPERYWSPTCPQTGDGDESNPAASTGLTIARRSETIEKAGKAINPKDPAQAKWLARLPATDRDAVQAWNADNNIRGEGSHRVREFLHWQRNVGTMVVPETRPTHAPMLALADAKLDGPLEDWLVLAATMQVERWPNVRRYMVACGHPAWAADEAARRTIARVDPYRERAKLHGMRAETFYSAVSAAETRLRDWLLEGANRFLAQHSRPLARQVNHGEASAHRAETWWHPERESENAPRRRNR